MHAAGARWVRSTRLQARRFDHPARYPCGPQRRLGRRGRLSFDDDLLGEVSRGARALVVCPDIRGTRHDLDAEARLEEACGLALAIGIVVADAFVLPVRDVRPGTLFGSGQVDNIATRCELEEAELVVIDGALSPIQQRNLEEKLKRKVIDRTGLILEIFGERAATAEGRLQVELAHLDYQQSRLVRSWTHLERQRGGFGFLGGPGETQIEADRRMIRQRMGRLRKELEQVRRTRALHRERRGRAPWPVIALVGYTNAGKSTLFNRLTGADVMAEDLLFATLDPTMAALEPVKSSGGQDIDLFDDPRPLAEQGGKAVVIVVGEDVGALRQQGLDHRVALVRKLDNSLRGERNQPIGSHIERNIAADRDVVDERQRDDRIGCGTVGEPLALALCPSLRWAGIGGIEPQREEGEVFLFGAIVGEFEGSMIEVEAHHPCSAAFERDLGIITTIATKIEQQFGPDGGGHFGDERCLCPHVFALITVASGVVAPHRCM
ncbi:GTPase HflX [Leptolyngbya sp. 15MV]|nr:GTPase HflX [Leptolyngbya sp. 15MV]